MWPGGACRRRSRARGTGVDPTADGHHRQLLGSQLLVCVVFFNRHVAMPTPLGVVDARRA